jgi:hypothetical protein
MNAEHKSIKPIFIPVFKKNHPTNLQFEPGTCVYYVKNPLSLKNRYQRYQYVLKTMKRPYKIALDPQL